jgi:hypothetical protein
MRFGDKEYVEGQSLNITPPQAAPVQPPPSGALSTATYLDSVTVRPTEEELRIARMSNEPLSFMEKLDGGLGMISLWDSPAEYRAKMAQDVEGTKRLGASFLRGFVKGNTDILDLVAPYARPPSYAAQTPGLSPETNEARVPSLTDITQSAMTDAGLMLPETPGQRAAQTIGEYTGPVASLSKLPIKAFKTQLPLQYAASTSGGAAESIARETGATSGEQKAAGILTLLGVTITGPLLNLTKRMLAGGATPQQIESAVRDFERLGTTPTAGQASGRSIVQTAEQGLSNYPGSATVIADFGQAQQMAIGSKVGQMAKDLSPKSSPTKAGEAIEEGAVAFRQRSIGKGGTAEQMYSKSEASIPQGHTVLLDETVSALDDLTRPIVGLEKASAAATNEKISVIAKAIKDDIADAASKGISGVPFESVKQFRTIIGDLAEESTFNPSLSKRKLDRLYAVLSDDIEKSLANNPKALKDWKAATRYRKNVQSWLDDIGAKLDKEGGPEKIFTALVTGVSDGATQLERVMRVLSPEQRKVVASAFLKKIGVKAKGADDASLIEQFDTVTFLRNYNNLSKEAKRALFGRNQFGKTFADDMDAITRVAKNITESGAYLANRPGTARQAATGSVLSAVLALPAFVGALSGGAGPAAAAGAVSAAKAAIVSTVGAYSVSKLMTNPKFVRWLASTSKMPPKAGAAQVDLLAKANRDDEDIQEFAKEYKLNFVPSGGGFGGDREYTDNPVKE